MTRITRAEAEALPTINHGASESQGHCGDTVPELHGRNRVEIVGARHSGKVRIKAPSVWRADHLLQDDCHLFFFQAVGCGTHVGFRVLAEGGCIDALDGLHKPLEPHRQVGMLVCQHEGFVHSRERLVLRIFKQAGGTHRQWIMHLHEKLKQLVAHGRRKSAFQKSPHDCVVVGTIEREVGEVVLGQKAIEDVGGQNDSGRNAYLHLGKQSGEAMLAQKVAHERQATGFAAERANPDPQKESVGGSERRGTEVTDKDFALFAAIVGNGGDQVAAQVLGTGEIGDLSRAQFLGKSELRSRHQPGRKMITLRVVGDAFCRYFLQHGFQRAQIGGASHF